VNAAQWFSEWLAGQALYGPATAALTLWIETDPESAWSFILLLIEHAPTEHAMQCVAAGPAGGSPGRAWSGVH
jgi:hypothetical protein